MATGMQMARLMAETATHVISSSCGFVMREVGLICFAMSAMQLR
jgi:hypothetical protein